MGKPLAISNARAAYLIARSEVSAAFATAESRPRRGKVEFRGRNRAYRAKKRERYCAAVFAVARYLRAESHGERRYRLSAERSASV